MNKLVIFAVVLIIPAYMFAQDPGIPDTVKVGTVYADLGLQYVDVPIYVVTDEDVSVYNMPIAWSIETDGIEPSEVFYYSPLTHWDETFDSVLVDEHFMRMIGWVSDFFYLNTGGYRMLCWEIRFTIDDLAPPQIVNIDTIYDPVNGSLFFGSWDGNEQWIPNFIPGAIYYGVTSGAGDDSRILPGEFSLLQNYPNPFNASTTIEFTLPKAAEVELSVYNILGQKKVTLYAGRKQAGRHSFTWVAKYAPSGVYFARLETIYGIKNIKMLLLK